MNVWYEYRGVWAARPGLLALAILGVVMVAAGIAGTVAARAFAVLFIPGIAVLFLHHFLVKKQAG